MKTSVPVFIVALVVAFAPASSQTPNLPQSAFPRFTMIAGQLDEDGSPTSGAKLCVIGRPDTCYQMSPERPEGPSSVTHQFGLAPLAERLPLAGGESLVFFSGTFSGGGSGTLTRLAVLRYDGGSGKIVDLLPFVGVTNISERAMWTVSAASPYPVLVLADFVWGKGEGHFAPHFYTVEAWKFDRRSGRYGKAISYQTTKKYDGGDAPIRVLGPERGEILRRLATSTR
jgi:hypothetical protein